jgi:hypothetical protein
MSASFSSLSSLSSLDEFEMGFAPRSSSNGFSTQSDVFLPRGNGDGDVDGVEVEADAVLADALAQAGVGKGGERGQRTVNCDGLSNSQPLSAVDWSLGTIQAGWAG